MRSEHNFINIVFLEAQVQSSLQASNMQEYLTLVPGYGKRNQNKQPPWFQ